MKVLIVDDRKEELYLLETLLKGIGYEIVSATNGAEAIEKLRAEGADMMISDILMPVMDGFRFCREVKGDEKLKDIPFVFCTATYKDERDEELASKVGADKLIRKPIEPDEFIKIIQGVIRRVEEGKIERKKPILEEEKEVFKLYSERLVKKLEKKMLDLEREVTERKRAEEKIKHLNLVLRAIRKVNQLIIREKDRDRLLKATCNNLIKNRGYHNAWIALVDESEELGTTAEAGLGEDFLPMVEWLKRGKSTKCGRRALTQSDVVVIGDPASTCTDCPLAKKYQARGAMTVRLEHGGKAYGLLSASIARDLVGDKQEQSLFEEVAGDIAFGLHGIELEENRKQAEEALRKRTYDLGERVKELNCLYDISSLVEKQGISLDEILQGTVDLIPPAWQYPEITCAQIILEGQTFKTKNLKETIWKQASDIIVDGDRLGTLEVFYLEEKPESDEGPFLKEERILINIIAERLGRITERKRAEEKIKEYSKNLERMVEERTDGLTKANEELQREMIERKRVEEGLRIAKVAAEVASHTKSDFLASMSHELRTPLNAIIGFSEVLRDQYFGKLNEKQEDYVNDILESGKHLLSLINDVLDLSKIEAGRIELELSKVRLEELLENSLIMIKERCMKHGINLSLNIAQDLKGLEIMADERRLKQVIFNLLFNATKFTPDGGAITLKAGQKGEELVISVKDTGIGIPTEDQEKIFEEFYQIKGSLADKTPGTGLGLSLVKRLVEMHGGRIWVESEGVRKGSQFTFSLPIR